MSTDPRGPGEYPDETSSWAVGGATFAACMILIIGVFQVIAALTAIFDDGFYIVTSHYAFDLDPSAWGWIHLIIGVLMLPLDGAIVMLPVLGVMLNGTSSVLYGTVPELTPAHRTARAFAVFYTGTIGAGAGAPVLYGLLGDAFGPAMATTATAVTALAICPLMIALSRHLKDNADVGAAEPSSGEQG